MYEQYEFNKERKTIKLKKKTKTKTEIPELKDTMIEPKNSIENFNSRFKQTKEKKSVNLKISYLKLSREKKKKF